MDSILRVEVIPCKSFRDHLHLKNQLNNQKKKKLIKHVSDLGTCFYVEHFKVREKAYERI